MTVREAINLLAYGTAFYIKGAYSGKIYHKSYENRKEHLEKFLDEHVSLEPFLRICTQQRKNIVKRILTLLLEFG